MLYCFLRSPQSPIGFSLGGSILKVQQILWIYAALQCILLVACPSKHYLIFIATYAWNLIHALWVVDWCSGLTSRLGLRLGRGAAGSIPKSGGGENVCVHSLCMGIGVHTAL